MKTVLYDPVRMCGGVQTYGDHLGAGKRRIKKKGGKKRK